MADQMASDVKGALYLGRSLLTRWLRLQEKHRGKRMPLGAFVRKWVHCRDLLDVGPVSGPPYLGNLIA